MLDSEWKFPLSISQLAALERELLVRQGTIITGSKKTTKTTDPVQLYKKEKKKMRIFIRIGILFKRK